MKQSKNDKFEELYLKEICPELVKRGYIAPFNDDEPEDVEDLNHLLALMEFAVDITVDPGDLKISVDYLENNKRANRFYIKACLKILDNNHKRIDDIITKQTKKNVKDFIKFDIRRALFPSVEGSRSTVGLSKVKKLINPREGDPYLASRWVRLSKKEEMSGGSSVPITESRIEKEIARVESKLEPFFKKHEKEFGKSDLYSAFGNTQQRTDQYLPYTKIKDEQFTGWLFDKHESSKTTSHIYTSEGGGYTEERSKLHDVILKDYVVDQKAIKPIERSEKPIVIFTGGGSGAGKSTVMERLTEHGIINNDFLHIDSDMLKGYLPEYNIMVASDNPSAARRVHAESSMLALKLFDKAVTKEKVNTIYDGTMKDRSKYKKMIDHAVKNGCDVLLVGVKIDPKEALKRCKIREEHTGRKVPQEIILDSHSNFNDVYESLIQEFGNKVQYITVDNNSEPKIVDTNHSKGKKLTDKPLTPKKLKPVKI